MEYMSELNKGSENNWTLVWLLNLEKVLRMYLQHSCALCNMYVWPSAKDGPGKAPYKNFEMVPTWKMEKGKTSKFVDAGDYNRIDREGGICMGRQRSMEKENKFTLGTKRCENIKNLNINK